MKLRNIFTALAATLALTFVGCQEEERFLDEVQVSQSMLPLPVEGGKVEVTVTATEDWELAEVKDVWPNVIERDKDGNVVSTTPSWLSVDKMLGAAGETVVTFSAEATAETRELVLSLNCGGVTQMLTVLQMAEKIELPITDCATVLAEKEVGKVYKVKGTVTDLTNYGKYGCFYVNDGTGTVYVYGSMNSSQFEPEVGDIITFEGPWSSYGNFDDVTILSLEKSLIKLEKVFPAEPLPLDGGVATVLLTVKEGDLEIVIPEDAAWLTAGEPTALGGMTSVELTAAPNEGGARSTTVTFKVNVGDKDYIAMADIEQLGAISEVSVADFLAAAEGTALYELSGVITNITSAYSEKYGNISFVLKDATGEVDIYRMSCEGIADPASIAVGDVVTVQGTRASYNEKAQMGAGGVCVYHRGTTVSTIGDFLAASVNTDTWYKLTGTIEEIVKEEYGNFYLKDDTGSVYVYGLTAAPVAKNDKSFSKLGLKVGDIVTIVGTRSDYEGTAQVGGPAYYISHETPAAGEGGSDAAAAWSLGAANQTWTEATHATYGAGYSTTIDGVGLAYYKYNSQTDPIAPKDDHIRVYQDSYFVITPATGKKIKSVTIECAGDKTGPIKVGETEYTATDNVITWTGDVDVFEAYAVKQTRIAKVTVVSE